MTGNRLTVWATLSYKAMSHHCGAKGSGASESGAASRGDSPLWELLDRPRAQTQCYQKSRSAGAREASGLHAGKAPANQGGRGPSGALFCQPCILILRGLSDSGSGGNLSVIPGHPPLLSTYPVPLGRCRSWWPLPE